MNRVLMNRCRRCVARASALVFRPMRLQAVALSTTAVDDDFVRRAALKDREMRSKHFELKEDYPKESFAPGKEESTTFDEVYRKRLIYRAKQRGWLEVDLLLGSWATKHVHSLTEEQCREFEELLKVETLDIYNFIIGKDTPPDAIASNSVLKMLQDYTKTQPLGKASPEGYAKVKPMMSN